MIFETSLEGKVIDALAMIILQYTNDGQDKDLQLHKVSVPKWWCWFAYKTGEQDKKIYLCGYGILQ